MPDPFMSTGWRPCSRWFRVAAATTGGLAMMADPAGSSRALARTGLLAPSVASPDGIVEAAVAEGYGVANSGALASVNLAGSWAFRQLQPAAAPTTIQVPGGGWVKQGFASTTEAIYSRSITVPDIGTPQTVILEFGAVNHEATLTIDGRTVGTTVSSYTPASFDLTPFVKAGGTYAIALRVKGRGALMKDGKYLVAEGAEWSDTVPQGIYRSAFLRVYPQTYVASAFVKTSVAGRTISYDVELRNTGDRPRTVTLTGALASASGGEFRYPSIPDTTVTVPAHGTVTKTIGPIGWTAGDASYWWPNIPYKKDFRAQLHRLTVDLKGGDGTRQTVRTRFGFREFTQPPNGKTYALNGVPINLRGDNLQVADYDRVDRNGKSDAVDFLPGFLPPSKDGPGWPQAVDNYQRLNFNVVRLHQSPVTPYMIDVLDEMGMMAIGETAIRGSAGRENFIAGHDNMVSHARDLVLQNRNHPSIIEWSQSNEADQADTDSEQFEKDLFKAIRTADPTRPIIADGPPPGHYPTMTPANGYTQFNTFEHYIDGFGNYGTALADNRTAPVGETEYIWPATSTKAGFTWFTTATVGKRGKGAADLRPYTLLSGWAGFVPGTRTTDFITEENRPPLYGEDNLADPWSHPQIRLLQRGFSPYLVADLPFWDESGRSDEEGTFPVKSAVRPLGFGKTVTRDVTVFNDGLRGTSLDFAWQVRAETPEGPVLASGARKLDVPLAGRLTVPVTFTTPISGTAVYLLLSSSVDGVTQFTDSSEYLPLGSASTIDDARIGTGDREMNYTGAWRHTTGQAGAYAATLSSAGAAGAAVRTTFTGNLASIHAATGPDRGIVAVSVDGGAEIPVDLYTATPAVDREIWSSPVLASGGHALIVRVTGRKNAAATGTAGSVDRIEVPTSLTTAIAQDGSEQCLEPRGGAADGAVVGIARCSGRANQSWTIERDGRIVNRETRKCLDVAGASVQDGALVQQWSCNGGGNQNWRYDLSRRLINPVSGKCLSTASQDRLVIRGCDEAAANRWKLAVPAKASVPAAPTDVTAVAVAGTGAATVSWKAPPSDGGADITKYKVSSVPPSKGCVTSTGWSTYTCTVPGLAKETTYVFTVTAQNGIGIGSASAPSMPVRP